MHVAGSALIHESIKPQRLDKIPISGERIVHQ